MVRKRNESFIEAAQKAAQDIMLEKGYNAASYTLIANRAGVARTTVQHYFPAKESFATGIMERIAEVAKQRALEMTPAGESAFVTYYLMSQLAYGVFYLTEGTRRFLADISASRVLQHAAAPDYLGAAFEQLSISDPAKEDLFEWQYALGGVFETHYLCLRDGVKPDLAQLLRRTMETLARMAGIELAECNRVIEQYTLDDETLFAIGRELFEAL